MKKRLLVALSALFAGSMNAQLPVSTTPENKNVVLEEFTGIYCVYCPDGHKRANQLADQNPGDVVLINIHQGGYADPQGGDPDFRTAFGNAIVNQTGIKGYPAGTINRHVFSVNPEGKTVLNRTEWASAASVILNQPSYVNLALEGEIDPVSRTLTVNVEVYFTSGDAPSNVRLNVVLLQNDVEGPQTGMNSNSDQILPNGMYNHVHMLRHMLTGQWGEVIDSTSEGTLIEREYIYTLPDDISDIDLLMEDLEIAGFIAEGRQEIITGAKGVLNIVAPSGYTMADIAIESAIESTESYCEASIVPEVLVTNNETFEVDSFEVSYSYAGQTGSKVIETTLAGGQSTTVSLDPITVEEGSNVFEFVVKFDENSKKVDGFTRDNKAKSINIHQLQDEAVDTRLISHFESEAVGTIVAENTLVDNPDGIQQLVLSQAAVGGVSYDIGGFGKSPKSYWWRLNGSASGDVSTLVYEKIDLSGTVNAKIRFSYSYAQSISSDNDKLEVLLSKDCGTTWTTVFSESGSTLATTSPININTRQFFPRANEWESDTIDVGDFDGETEVVLAVRVTSDQGNGLFIDDLFMMDGTQIGIKEEKIEKTDRLSVYPNPAVSEITISSEEYLKEEIQIRIMDISGKTVKESIEYGNEIRLDVGNLQNGVYILETKGAGKMATTKFVISR